MKGWKIERKDDSWVVHKPGGFSFRFDDLAMAKLMVLAEGAEPIVVGHG